MIRKERIFIYNKNVLKSYFKLLRPEISLMDITLPLSASLLSLYYSTYNIIALFDISYLLISIVGGFFAITSSYIFNDCVDIDVDTINLPNRPIPSGMISKLSATIYGLILIGISILISYLFNFQTLILLLLSFSIIITYSSYIKRKSPFSFLLVGISYGLVPIGIFTSINPVNIYISKSSIELSNIPLFIIIFGVMICITDFGFSLLGVCRDIEGDSKRKIPTFPVTYGINNSSKVIYGSWIVGFILSFLLGIESKMGMIYYFVTLLSGSMILINCYYFIQYPESNSGGKLFLLCSLYRSIIFLGMILNIICITNIYFN